MGRTDPSKLKGVDPRITPSHPARPGPIFFIGRAILRPTLWLKFWPRITGREHVPAEGPVLLASNHLSGFDTILIPSYAPRQVQFLAKASLFHSKLGHWFFTSIGAVPVHREASSAAQTALDIGREVLAAGSVFAVFPEGSRSRDGRLYRGRSGAAWLALETGAKVVPVGLVGTNTKLRDPLTGKRQRTAIHYGKPLDLGDLSGLPAGRARREATERIMRAIQELTGQERADSYAEGGRGA